MRYLLLLIVLLQTGRMSAHTAESARDSLRAVLSQTSDPKVQLRVYRDLADLTYETPESCGYLLHLVETARAAHQIRPMMEALADLTVTYLLRDMPDSARSGMSLTDKYAPEEQRDQWNCYLEMRILASDLLNTNATQAVEDKVEEIKKRDIAGESLYRKITAEYNIGTILYNNDENAEALPYLLNALNLAKKLPFREGGPYQLLIMRQLSRVYSVLRDSPKSIEITKATIEFKERYYNLFDKAERPFYPMDDFYITNYSALLIHASILPAEEVEYYLDRLIEMSDRSKSPFHKYNRFHAQFNHSVIHKNLRQALVFNDSLIYYAHKIATYSLPNLYQINSNIYEMLGEDKNALVNLREAHRLQDSIRQNDTQEQLNKMRVEYDVNRLNYEKSQLEIRNKQTLVVSLAIGLAVVIALCIYLYLHLRREQERKLRMLQLKMQAEESEKLKTAFINLICHEIRTPLNCIAGYSELLFDPTIEEQERLGFPEQIRKNSSELVSLIDSMLEVSNLDVLDEKLPCEPVDVTRICRSVMEQSASENNNARVITTTAIQEEPLIICTNERYLRLVIGNLLANAFKFTEQGRATLSCRHNGNNAVISVEDTGCGIPENKHAEVFNRFTKLDTHTQGTGLGLYLCKQIIRRLSGRIYIDPEYTQGTRVVVILTIDK